MLAGYADRSTVEAGGVQVFTVVAAIAPATSWDQDFAPAWEAALVREEIEYFHMTDYESRRVEPYKSWTDDKRVAFISELIGVLKGTEMVAGAVSLDLRAYNKLTQSQRNWVGHP